MIIKKLQLKNYRNYEDLDITFNDRLNILIGDNAQGKTNILESIYVLAVTKSYLGVNDKNLIKLGSKFSLAKSMVEIDGIHKQLEILINDNGKKVKVNDKEVKKLSDYISKFCVILFSPDNIRMIKEGPSVRRKFLNVELSQLSNKYVKLLNDYNTILKQRNEFIRLMSSIHHYDENYLSVINQKFSELAVEVYLFRKKFLDKINACIGSIYQEITDTDHLTIQYISNIEFDDDKQKMVDKLFDKLNKSLEKDKNYGVTLTGPHRDDFYFYLDGKNISLYGSQGQLRVAVLSLKLSEINIFYQYTGDKPILLLDDIFSELDFDKKNKLIQYISDDIQTIITTTDIHMIDSRLVEKANVYTIKEGKIISREII